MLRATKPLLTIMILISLPMANHAAAQNSPSTLLLQLLDTVQFRHPCIQAYKQVRRIMPDVNQAWSLTNLNHRCVPTIRGISPPIDLDDDGDPDYVVFRRGAGTKENDFSAPAESIFILRNYGSGEFGIEEQLNTKMYCRFCVTADFNNDGLDDMVSVGDHVLTTIDGVEQRASPVGLLLQNADGKLIDESLRLQDRVYADWHGLSVADVDSDGDLDFVALSLGKEAYAFENDGSANFSLASFDQSLKLAIDASMQFTAALLIDINHDNFPDLVLGDGGGLDDSPIFVNDSRGFRLTEDKLNPEIPYSEGDELITVTLDALDITGDGCIDIVQNQVNYYVADENYIVSWEGNCVGSFQLRSVNSYNGNWLRESDVYDYNRDGLMDFLVYDESGYVLFLNTGDGLQKFSGTKEEFQSMNNRILLLNYSFISQG